MTNEERAKEWLENNDWEFEADKNIKKLATLLTQVQAEAGLEEAEMRPHDLNCKSLRPEELENYGNCDCSRGERIAALEHQVSVTGPSKGVRKVGCLHH